jgi:hypothetical protein
VQSTNVWTPNQWVGYTLVDTNAQAAGGGASGQRPWFSLCYSNSANIIYLCLLKNDSGEPIAFTNGQTFQMVMVYPQIDQVGRGSGDLISGDTPTNTTTGVASYAHQAYEPLYYWANTLNGSPVSVSSGYPNVVDGRDITNAVFNYTPLVYPHPLAQ